MLLIESFSCKETKKIWNRKFSKRFPPNIQSQARRKLIAIDISKSLNDKYIIYNRSIMRRVLILQLFIILIFDFDCQAQYVYDGDLFGKWRIEKLRMKNCRRD